jgi:hypothetical protein
MEWLQMNEFKQESVYFFSAYVFILIRLILDLLSAIAFALWTGRMGLRGEIDITWNRPWPVLR